MVKEYLDLVVTFFRMGCVTFGGGYAMLPILERELVAQRRWATREELMDYFAIGQVTPGLISVNVSTFIGCKRKGIAGGILCTLGFVLPSLIIITLIALFLENLADMPLLRHAFAGIRVAVGALILDAVLKLAKTALRDWKALGICTAAFALSAVFKASPALLVAAAGLAGFLLYRPSRPPAGN